MTTTTMSGKGKEEDQAPRALSHRDREDTDKRPSLAQQKRHSSSRDLTKHSVKDSSERSRYSLQYTKEPLRDKDSLKYKADKDYHRDKDAPLSARDSLKYTKDDPRDRDYHRDRDREPKSARDSLKYTKDTTQYNRSPYRDRDTANLGHYSSPRKDRDTAHRHYRESPLSARGSRKSTKDRDIEDKQSQDRDRDSGSNRGRDRGDSNKGGKEARSRSRGEDFRRSARNSFRYSVRESARDTESSLGMGEPTDFLLRCMIMESTYGVCLFDHVWSWKASDDETPSNSTANTLAKLVFSFFQISLSLKGTQKGQSSDPVSSSPGIYFIFDELLIFLKVSLRFYLATSKSSLEECSANAMEPRERYE